MLSQLSYAPIFRLKKVVGTGGLEPPTSRLSGVRSNHLSYAPVLSLILSWSSRTLKIKQRLDGPLHLYNVTDLGLDKLFRSSCLHRKEVIQPLVLERLPCYDFTPIANPTFGSVPLAVRQLTSGITGSHGVTGGVYKARERIHRGMLIRDY